MTKSGKLIIFLLLATCFTTKSIASFGQCVAGSLKICPKNLTHVENSIKEQISKVDCSELVNKMHVYERQINDENSPLYNTCKNYSCTVVNKDVTYNKISTAIQFGNCKKCHNDLRNFYLNCLANKDKFTVKTENVIAKTENIIAKTGNKTTCQN